jgi:tetratricopeptide (TPR) repeat protein
MIVSHMVTSKGSPASFYSRDSRWRCYGDEMTTIAEVLRAGHQHHQQGNLEQAERCYREVLGADPHHEEALALLGGICLQQGRLDEALARFRTVRELHPSSAEAHMNLGTALAAAGKDLEAETMFRQAIALRPDWALAYFHLGNVLSRRHRLEEAVVCYRRALLLNPADPQTLNNLGTVLVELNQPNEAVRCYHQALRLRPDYFRAYSNLATAYCELNEFEQAAACCHQALQLDPSSPEVLNTLGSALLEQGKAEEALVYLEQARRLKPDFAGVYHNLGAATLELGQPQQALEHFRQAIRCDPNHATAHMSLGMVHLLLGQFEEGWTEYAWRWKTREFIDRGFVQPPWDGGSLDGKTILLHVEQGLGDTLQFIRYAPMLKKRGGKVVAECQPALRKILRRTPGIDQLVSAGEPLPAFDVQIPFLNLPLLFGTTLATIPADVPYVFADAELVERWREDLGGIAGRKIGINWQGNPKNKKDRRRSFPLDLLRPLALIPEVRLISLQKGAGVDQLREAGRALGVVDLGERLDEMSGPFMDTAAVMKNLDLVVTSDSATAHLAGALGVPVWVALPFLPDWRWQLKRPDCPWYPTMHLFRQPRPGDWESVFAEIAQTLSAH